MIKTTPFHARLDQLNEAQRWGHWSGYLSALKYGMAPKHEYFAVRNSAGFFDTSPLYKHRITGPDAERLLADVMTRDIRQCRPGRAQYTVWCDDRGFVLEDGVVFRHSETEFLLTAAEPNFGYLGDLVGRLNVTIEDVTDDYGMLAVQGPRSRQILAGLAPEVDRLGYFEHADAKIATAPVTVSRTGYTGDLGYEVRVRRDEALAVLDAVIEAGEGHGLRPFGEEALLMTRIEAGLVLINVEFSSSRYAYTDHDRITPKELGFGWMLKGIDADDRPFIGRDAIRRELVDKTSRWASVGLVLDWADYDRVYDDAGLIPPKDETPQEYESMLYDDAGERIGYATSLMYSPMLQRHIALARVRPDLAASGTRVNLELTINHHYETVAAEVTRLPFFNPPPKDGVNMASTDNSYDVIVVGGGHNGLVNGAYLAKAGLKVLILERRHVVGGAAITEELRPGFQFTSFSYALSLLRPDIVHELDLVRHGFMPILMPSSFAPMENGDYLLLGQDRDENIKEIMRHSPHDADAMDRYEYDVERVCQLVKPLLDKVPPNVFGHSPDDLADTAELVKHLRGADQKVIHDLVRLLTGSAADFLDDYFESDILKGYIASSGIIGTKVGPMSQGSGMVLLYHSIGEHDGHFGAWSFHKGGNGGFTQVLARAAQAFGAEIVLNAPVDSVITRNGRAVGVALEDGTELTATTVVSALDPRRTFTQLVEPRELPGDLVENINRMRFQGTSAKVNFALDGAPRYPALGDRTDQYLGFVNIGPSMEYLERAFDDAKYGWYSQRPYIDCAIQSFVDPDMAPPGKHVMSCFVQYAPYHLKESDWDTEREPFADTVQATLESFFPGFGDLVLQREVKTPLDIERTVGLTEGNIFAGEFFAPQMYFFRPAPGWSQYRTPIDGYYQCGSGTHPGGCVMGAPGRLASQQILHDLKAGGA